MTEQTDGLTIVLGATGSVGRCVVDNLVSAEQRVLAAGRDAEKLHRLFREEVTTASYEPDSPGAIGRLIEDAAREYGPLTGIVNCIGSILLKPAHLTSDEEFETVMKTNLGTSFETLRASAKAMRATGGSIVFVSTAAARIGIPSHEAIAAAKAGIEGMARSAAATYARHGIRVNVVAPGLVKSEISRQVWENETAAAASREMHALGRLGEPSDIASLISWFLCPSNNWITGQVIAVDGGLSSVIQRRKR